MLIQRQRRTISRAAAMRRIDYVCRRISALAVGYLMANLFRATIPGPPSRFCPFAAFPPMTASTAHQAAAEHWTDIPRHRR